jgi:uncharacterized repeat protein (TIGR03803 family)
MIFPASWKRILIVSLLSVFVPIASAAPTFKTLIIFDGTNGGAPVDTPLVQGTNGNLYGTTLGGGTQNSGTVFEITRAGKLKTLYSFCSQTNCTDGSLPYGGLVLGRDGNFYGTTSQGGANGTWGTVFRITPSGTLTTLHSFSGTDGFNPAAPMILASDGNFYGITQNGGTNGFGTIFKLTQAGTFSTLYDFGSSDGFFLNGPLVEGPDGNFYGTAESGGANGFGTIFQVTPGGSFTTFFSFNSTDGSAPASGLLSASDGNLYGTTYEGGSSPKCPNGCGTAFKITTSGTLTTLHDFDLTEGANPIAALIQATDGNFYGTTYGGGTANWGVVFKMTPGGTVTTLHSFQGTDGAQPYGPVAQATSGNLYGTSTNGTGSANQGTVFAVETGFSPFVGFVSNTGKISQSVGILGQGFTGTTSVSFNGISAAFKVRSGTFITATVPAGATSGFVQVATPTKTLTSNVPFQVVP